MKFYFFSDGKGSTIRLLLTLALLDGVFIGCSNQSGVANSDSKVDSLENISIEELTEEVEYEDEFIDTPKVVQHKKHWQDYRGFVSKLKKDHWSTLLEQGSKDNGVSNLSPLILGDKKWVLITPAFWQNSSDLVFGDKNFDESEQILSPKNSVFIKPNNVEQNGPNGKVSLGKLFFDLGQQDVYMDILLAPKSGYATEFEGKSNVIGPWSDVPLAGKGVSTVLEKAKKGKVNLLLDYSLYLVVAFPLHKKKPLDTLDSTDLLVAQKIQEGIRKYILDEAGLKSPWGTSLDSFFSRRILRNSLENSQGSYTSRAMFSAGMQVLLSQYKAASLDTFSQMSGTIFDGFPPKEVAGKSLSIPPGYLTHSILYKEGDVFKSTYNSVVTVPFLIDKVLEDVETGKKGLLLKGNPLGVRVFSIQPEDIDVASYTRTDVPQATKTKGDSMQLDSFSSFSDFESVFTSKDEAARRKKVGNLGDVLGKFASGDGESIKKDLKSIFSILANQELKKKDLQESAADTSLVEKIPQLSQEVSNKLQEFSWSALKKFFDEEKSRQTLLQVKNRNLSFVSDFGAMSAPGEKVGVAASSNIKNHNVGALLQYGGFDLIFWPEDDLKNIFLKLQSDFKE